MAKEWEIVYTYEREGEWVSDWEKGGEAEETEAVENKRVRANNSEDSVL